MATENGAWEAGVDRQLGTLEGDVTVLKTDVAVLKTDVAVLKTDVAVLKTDMAEVKRDLKWVRWLLGGMISAQVGTVFLILSMMQTVIELH